MYMGFLPYVTITPLKVGSPLGNSNIKEDSKIEMDKLLALVLCNTKLHYVA